MHAIDDYLRVCRAAAVRGGAVLRSFAGPIGLRRKSARDLVTAADEAAQAEIFEVLTQAFPEHLLLGEEQPGDRPDHSRELVWTVDPLDGTTNFVHGFPHWCVSVALLREGRPIVGSVYDPNREEHFWAAEDLGSYLNGDRITVALPGELDQALVACSFGPEVTAESEEIRQFLQLVSVAQAMRRTGSTALNLAYIAAGRIDACWTIHNHIWDVAAGALLVTEAGGCVATVHGQPWQPASDPAICAAANKRLLDAMVTRWRCSA